jgi:hypothetical protein
MKSQLSQISSDSFCINILHVMHELSVPFLNINDEKQMWKKIDPSYLPSGLRMDLTDETPICNVPRDKRKPLTFPKEYGTITEFYFMEIEMMHYGLHHILRKYTDIRKLIDNLRQERTNA